MNITKNDMAFRGLVAVLPKSKLLHDDLLKRLNGGQFDDVDFLEGSLCLFDNGKFILSKIHMKSGELLILVVRLGYGLFSGDPIFPDTNITNLVLLVPNENMFSYYMGYRCKFSNRERLSISSFVKDIFPNAAQIVLAS